MAAGSLVNVQQNPAWKERGRDQLRFLLRGVDREAKGEEG